MRPSSSEPSSSISLEDTESLWDCPEHKTLVSEQIKIKNVGEDDAYFQLVLAVLDNSGIAIKLLDILKEAKFHPLEQQEIFKNISNHNNNDECMVSCTLPDFEKDFLRSMTHNIKYVIQRVFITFIKAAKQPL